MAPVGIDNRYQSITTQSFAIDWSLIININRLTDIDCHRFHRLDTPGLIVEGSWMALFDRLPDLENTRECYTMGIKECMH